MWDNISKHGIVMPDKSRVRHEILLFCSWFPYPKETAGILWFYLHFNNFKSINSNFTVNTEKTYFPDFGPGKLLRHLNPINALRVKRDLVLVTSANCRLMRGWALFNIFIHNTRKVNLCQKRIVIKIFHSLFRTKQRCCLQLALQQVALSGIRL